MAENSILSGFPNADDVRKVFRRFDAMCQSTKDREEVAGLNAILRRAIEGPPLSLEPPICEARIPYADGSGYGPCERPEGHAGMHRSSHNGGALDWQRAPEPVRYEGDDK